MYSPVNTTHGAENMLCVDYLGLPCRLPTPGTEIAKKELPNSWKHTLLALTSQLDIIQRFAIYTYINRNKKKISNLPILSLKFWECLHLLV